MQDWKDMLSALRGDAPEAAPADIPEPAAVSPKQSLRVLIDKKGRKGKTATIIEGFTLPDDEVEDIASYLKRKIGTGGSARGGEILLQGEWKEKAVALLKEKGFSAKGI